MEISASAFLAIYFAIEAIKFLASKIISHKEQMTLISEIAKYQRDSAMILERILSAHDIKPKEVAQK
jgi:hypothetical protein